MVFRRRKKPAGGAAFFRQIAAAIRSRAGIKKRLGEARQPTSVGRSVGSRGVLLVSHWSVPSRATVRLIIDTFSELKKDPAIGRAEALHRAVMAMLDRADPPESAHPMFWAPFVLAGEGGAGR